MEQVPRYWVQERMVQIVEPRGAALGEEALAEKVLEQQIAGGCAVSAVSPPFPGGTCYGPLPERDFRFSLTVLAVFMCGSP